MNPTTAAVREWAELIVPQLGAPDGHSLTVTAAGSAGESLQPPPPGGPFASSVQVEWDEDGGAEEDGERDEDGEGRGRGGSATGSAASEGAGVMVTLAFSAGTSVSVHLEEPMDQADAVVLLADQLQDGVLEETGGVPHPPCPGGAGHAHPAVARVVDGLACWACPSEEGVRPILPPARRA